MEMINLTPFIADKMVMMNHNGYETLLVIVKATFDISPNGRLEIAQDQWPIQMADEYYGSPNTSSIKYESDLALIKANSDVVLIGHAWFRNPSQKYVDVSIQVDNTMKTVRVFGDRYWQKAGGMFQISDPMPTDKIQLIYEKAFGGIDDSFPDSEFHESEHRNLVGRGFFAKKTGRSIEGAMLPNIESPHHLIKRPNDRPAPAGFGFVSKHWQPRSFLAGTYDQTWQTKRMPLLPKDFRVDFYNGASHGLILNGYLNQYKNVAIENACEGGTTEFQLQVPDLETVVKIDDQFQIADLKPDTLIINTDERKVLIVERGSLNINAQVFNLQWIKTQTK